MFSRKRAYRVFRRKGERKGKDLPDWGGPFLDKGSLDSLFEGGGASGAGDGDVMMHFRLFDPYLGFAPRTTIVFMGFSVLPFSLQKRPLLDHGFTQL